MACLTMTWFAVFKLAGHWAGRTMKNHWSSTGRGVFLRYANHRTKTWAAVVDSRERKSETRNRGRRDGFKYCHPWLIMTVLFSERGKTFQQE